MAPPHPPDFFERDGCTIRAANGPREAGFSEGTWAYRAPECWASPERVAVASDVYAFGTLLWELLVDNPCGLGRGPLDRDAVRSRPRRQRPVGR
jgi:hypothetical protein